MPRHILIADGPAQPDATVIDKFWAEAQKSFPGLGEDYQFLALGIYAERTTQIFEYFKTRDIVATSSLHWVIEANGLPYFEPGTPIVLCNYVGTPHFIVRLTDVRETIFGDIGYAESSLDRPPVQCPEEWLPLHRRYWNVLLAANGRECTDDMPVLIEPFDCVRGRGNLMAMPTRSPYIIIGAGIHGNFWWEQNWQRCGCRRWRTAKNVFRARCPN